MSDKITKPPTTSDNSLSSALSYIGYKARIRFDGGSLKHDKITFNYEKTVNIYIIYEINLWNYVDSSDPTLKNSLFSVVKLLKNVDIDKYKYSGYGFLCDMKGTLGFPATRFGRNVIIFGVDMSLFANIDNKKKYILIIGEGPMQGLDDITLNVEIYIQLILQSIIKSSV